MPARGAYTYKDNPLPMLGRLVKGPESTFRLKAHDLIASYYEGY